MGGGEFVGRVHVQGFKQTSAHLPGVLPPRASRAPPSTPQQAVLRRQTLHSRLAELGWGRWLAGWLTLREPALEAVVAQVL